MYSLKCPMSLKISVIDKDFLRAAACKPKGKQRFTILIVSWKSKSEYGNPCFEKKISKYPNGFKFDARLPSHKIY